MGSALRMRHELTCFAIVFLLGIAACSAAVDPAKGLNYVSHHSGDLDAWQRIELRPSREYLRRVPEIKVAIQTRGPSMQGLIRIPGGLASNFDTGRGMTVVDLINPGDESRGYAEIIAIEIAFTQTTPGQIFRIFAVDD